MAVAARIVRGLELCRPGAHRLGPVLELAGECGGWSGFLPGGLSWRGVRDRRLGWGGAFRDVVRGVEVVCGDRRDR